MSTDRIMRAAVASLFFIAVLAGCTSSGGNQVVNTLATAQPDPKPVSAESQTALTAEPAPSPAELATGIQTGEPVRTASLDTSNSLTFLPIEGAPQGKVTMLSNSIQRAAVNQGLSVLPVSLTDSAVYKVKGYFSALNDGSGTLLVYIWDVQDPSGKLLHRINGQERSGATKSDPWQAITEKELARVADNTASRLKTWVETKN